MKRAVVTGGTGYIGSNLIKTLLKEDWCISIIADPRFGYSNIEDILSAEFNLQMQQNSD